MTGSKEEELEKITLAVYLYAVRKSKPVGPRDVMKGLNLSSPSVAYRHLQKLEDLSYLRKNEYGEYIIEGKANIGGHIWIGKLLMPKMWMYSLIFLVVLIVEIIILAVHFSNENYEFKVFFFLLTLITGAALTVFTLEGFLQYKRKRRWTQE